MMENYTIASAAHIGHANLKVANLGRALSFYRDVLGFQVRPNLVEERWSFWEPAGAA
jgi:catechol-2,3-dioxygenase